MIRAVNLVSVVVIIIISAALYQVKYETGATAREVMDLRRQLAAEKEQVRVLRAEWSHLNQPARLQDLAMRHLRLEPLAVDQIVALQDLPARPREAEAARPQGQQTR